MRPGGHLAEFGIIAALGPRNVMAPIARLRTEDSFDLPDIARSALLGLAQQLDALAGEVRMLESRLMAWHRQSAASQRLETIPGVGIIKATAVAASVRDPSVFKSDRQFSAWLGPVPRQNASGGKERLGRVSKIGNGYLRRLLVVGATSVTRRAPSNNTRTGVWVRSLLERKPARLATVAIATKTARPRLREPPGPCWPERRPARPYRPSEQEKNSDNQPVAERCKGRCEG